MLRLTAGTLAAVDVQDLTKRYGDKTVVDHLSMRVERGEVIGRAAILIN